MKTYAANEKNYSESAVHINHAFEEVKYLAMHGIADDNVHYQNAASLTEMLQSHGKVNVSPNNFRIHSVPDSAHSMDGTNSSREYVLTLMRDWFVDAFKTVDRERWALLGFTKTNGKPASSKLKSLESFCLLHHKLC